MPIMELQSSPDYSGDIKNWMQKREDGIQRLLSFFPVLWASEFSRNFDSELRLARQWAEDFAKQKNGEQDALLTLRRITDYNSIISRQGGDVPHYAQIFSTPPSVLFFFFFFFGEF